jgi:hypothetical protein
VDAAKEIVSEKVVQTEKLVWVYVYHKINEQNMNPEHWLEL